MRGTQGRWSIVGDGTADTVMLVNDYLDYLADRNYSTQTVRAYAYALLAFCRWLASERIPLDGVTTDVLLRFLAACRGATIPGRAGPNVVRMDGRRADGYAPATVNHRLAAISGLFAFRSLRSSRCSPASAPGGIGPSPGSWCSVGFAPAKCSLSRCATWTSAVDGCGCAARAPRNAVSLSMSTWPG